MDDMTILYPDQCCSGYCVGDYLHDLRPDQADRLVEVLKAERARAAAVLDDMDQLAAEIENARTPLLLEVERLMAATIRERVARHRGGGTPTCQACDGTCIDAHERRLCDIEPTTIRCTACTPPPEERQ